MFLYNMKTAFTIGIALTAFCFCQFPVSCLQQHIIIHTTPISAGQTFYSRIMASKRVADIDDVLGGMRDLSITSETRSVEPEAKPCMAHPDDTVRYLFRVSDYKSKGYSDEKVVQSEASLSGSNSSTYLLDMDPRAAARMLYRHLDWKAGGPPSDLVSWTSSLLFALQYAFYRCHHYGVEPKDVKICIVDTKRFGEGQFMRDTQLISALKRSASKLLSDELLVDAAKFFTFRLTFEEYYNGEYLS
ncbi:hypothetical protein BD289DRAFT_439147 [Coniella lustricola]|uniref:DUF7587 domain-containing protein n=1 Tax=Coniella lustricola TaxID=2025994 RepID=A0A2T3A211_9PEZI|nr:hypothetical protein BD289DRAFT_439147 [Coniella lustricola]